MFGTKNVWANILSSSYGRKTAPAPFIVGEGHLLPPPFGATNLMGFPMQQAYGENG